MNTRNTTCADCGAALAADAPRGLCPQCLLKAGLASDVTSANPSSDKTLVISAPIEPAPGAVASARTKVHYFGDYELIEEIARGGMGVVYKARQVSLNRIVAVKMIMGGHLAGEADIRRFRLEAEAAANLQHPNIVAIHEVGEHQGEHYFSMDYVEGVNLAQYAGGKPLSVVEAARLVQTLAEAVHYAHQRGTLHRDLKPQNVLIDGAGRPRITDFGLAKLVERESDLTRSGAVMGSPSYMPPEQAAGRLDRMGPASDVYALGAILYELLTGKAPFRGETALATLRQVIEEDPASPSKTNRLVPVDLETICLKCLEKRSERRYTTARDLAEELGRFLNQEPILARPASAARKAWSWLVRNPWLLMGATAVLMLGLIGLAYGLWEQNRYLVWTHAHPTASLGGSRAALNLPLILIIILGGFMGAPFCFGDFVSRKQRGMALGPRQLWAYAGLGTLFVLGSIAFSLAMIHDRIWQMRLPERSNHPWVFFFAVMVCAWFGGLLLFHVARELQICAVGLQPANEERLFPSAPRGGKPTAADRRGLNLLLVVVLLAVWLYRLLFPDVLTRQASLFFVMIAAEIPICMGYYLQVRKSVNRHVALWFAVICVFMTFGYVGRWDGADRETRQRLTAVAIGLSLGTVFAVGLARLEKSRRAGTLAAPEDAWFEWWDDNPGGAGLLALCLLAVVVAMAALLGGTPIRAALATIITLMAVLPHEAACWMRAKGRERQDRFHTVGLIAISALSAAFGLPRALAASGAGAGLLLGLMLVAFLLAKSKGASKT